MAGLTVFELTHNYVTVRKSTKLKQWTVSLARIDAESYSVNELTRSEWTELRLNFDRILTLLESDTYDTFEIGRRDQTISVEDYNGRTYVHIRQWWTPPSSDSRVPTRRGVMMQLAEFKELMDKADAISEALPKFYVPE